MIAYGATVGPCFTYWEVWFLISKDLPLPELFLSGLHLSRIFHWQGMGD